MNRIIGLVLALASAVALGQGKLNADEIVNRLAKPRSLASAAQDAGSGSTAPVAQEEAEGAGEPTGLPKRRNLRPMTRQVDLNIAFNFDSAVLTSEGQESLQQLATAVQSARLREARFRIEGHTDAKGGQEYNDRLSRQRAQSVVEFLVKQGIDAQRLESVGRGFRELLDRDEPFSAVNRRVRVVAFD